jgi:hypothetical protein
MSLQRFVKKAENALSAGRYSNAAGLVLIGSSVFIMLQFYFLRELLAAEFLLGLILIPLFTFVGIFYTIWLISDLGLQAIGVKVHSLTASKDQRLF